MGRNVRIAFHHLSALSILVLDVNAICPIDLSQVLMCSANSNEHESTTTSTSPDVAVQEYVLDVYHTWIVFTTYDSATQPKLLLRVCLKSPRA